MAPLVSLWTGILYVFDFLTNSLKHDHEFIHESALQIPVMPQASHYPIFEPSDGPDDGFFRCEYPEMVGWKSCNTHKNRSCWLSGPNNESYDINTDYEMNGPKGKIREYYLEVEQTTLSPDGVEVPWGQTFNGTYPGPRLRACWGDQLQVTVKNKLSTVFPTGNGTTIHWHGLRQWNTGWSDGVNAVTQCPIAPSDTFTYVFNVTQYGTSWYHSHYSLQYPNGLLAPLTIYGPSSRNYDHQIYPLVMTDWHHDSAFELWREHILNKGPLNMKNILLNGIGHWLHENSKIEAGLLVESPIKYHTVHFRQGMRYLLRLINAATATTFVFSIDHHTFWVIATDFVPIAPYKTDHIVVGIGQRYNIIVEAIPDEYPPEMNYWIRTIPAKDCNTFPDNLMPDNTTGIVRYHPNDKIPTTRMGNFSIDCTDETYFRNITPIVKWEFQGIIKELDTFYVDHDDVTGFPYWPCDKNVSRFSLTNSMWLNFSRPTLLHLNDDYSHKPWLAEVTTDTKNNDLWVKSIIQTGSKSKKNPTLPRPLPDTPGLSIPGMHPIHLHGHDFIILDQCMQGEDPNNLKCDTAKAYLNIHNPPRRDVAFLPDGGYLIIGFKPDNPGTWLMHCHIAFHASLGFALQIMENKHKINIPSSVNSSLIDMCEKWNEWVEDDPTNPCSGKCPNTEPLQEDSGI